MPVRRAADPLNVQYVWDAIKYSINQKQICDFPRISKFIQRSASCTQPQSELYIQQTSEDGLIVGVRKISQKGSNIGNEIESYKINRQGEDELNTPTDDGHDWYCIECHLAGEVTLCQKCYRVFHPECSTNARQKHTMFPTRRNHIANESMMLSDPLAMSDSVIDLERDINVKTNPEIDLESRNTINCDYIYDENLCSICNSNESEPAHGLNIDELNYLLNFVLCRIKSWVPENLTSTLSQIPKHEFHTPAELRWRSGQLFYQHMDMAAVELKIRTKEYENFTQFQADVVTMQHNVAIFHGVESQEYGAADLMMRDMKHDLSELQNCVDCYKHSNEKINSKWFCLPCRIPHELVWAKQKGYPYWPAKVIRETDTSCDVRFFGGKYERSVLPKNCIKPISTPISQLQVKKSTTFNKAVEELNFHKRLIENPGEISKYLVVNSPKKNNKKGGRLRHGPKSSGRKSKLLVSIEDVYEFQDSPVDTDKGENVAQRNSLTTEEKNPISPPKKAKMLGGQPAKNNQKNKGREDVIHISDVEDDRDGFHYMPDNCDFSDSGQEQVTSSTELVREDIFNSRESTEGVMQKLDQPYSDAVEKMRRKLEQCKDKKGLIAIAMDNMQAETDKLSNEHNDTLKKLFEAHNSQISETKKKQWCFNCEQDAIYHCCWNTAYCSPMCQQQHWQAEHKKVCRRKR